MRATDAARAAHWANALAQQCVETGSPPRLLALRGKLTVWPGNLERMRQRHGQMKRQAAEMMASAGVDPAAWVAGESGARRFSDTAVPATTRDAIQIAVDGCILVEALADAGERQLNALRTRLESAEPVAWVSRVARPPEAAVPPDTWLTHVLALGALGVACRLTWEGRRLVRAVK